MKGGGEEGNLDDYYFLWYYYNVYYKARQVLFIYYYYSLKNSKLYICNKGTKDRGLRGRDNFNIDYLFLVTTNN